MKKKLDKKRTRILSRFCALLSSLLLCMCLTVPAFASNNATTQKWYVTAERQLVTESGQKGRYLEVTPYVGGEVYSTYILTAVSSRPLRIFSSYETSGGVSASSTALAYPFYPINYPDWWRSALPLGAQSYMSVKLVGAWAGVRYPSLLPTTSYTPSGYVALDSIALHAFSRESCVDMTVSTTYEDTLQSSSYNGTVSFSSSNHATFRAVVPEDYTTSKLDFLYSPYSSLTVGNTTTTDLSSLGTLVPSPVTTTDYYKTTDSYEGFAWAVDYNQNLSSDDLVLAVSPGGKTALATNSSGYSCSYYIALVNISFYIDANKLPAGLEVGDEFPADNDAFEALREDLIEQFPESEEHIANDKADWEGLRDAETIPEDAANSFFELLGGVFQIDMFATIALMVCGFTALLILTRKAMN